MNNLVRLYVSMATRLKWCVKDYPMVIRAREPNQRTMCASGKFVR